MKNNNKKVASCHQTYLKLFPDRESLVSDIPAGDGKIANHFLQCRARDGGRVLYLYHTKSVVYIYVLRRSLR
jgi:hypothetical protein